MTTTPIFYSPPLPLMLHHFFLLMIVPVKAVLRILVLVRVQGFDDQDPEQSLQGSHHPRALGQLWSFVQRFLINNNNKYQFALNLVTSQSFEFLPRGMKAMAPRQLKTSEAWAADAKVSELELYFTVTENGLLQMFLYFIRPSQLRPGTFELFEHLIVL